MRRIVPSAILCAVLLSLLPFPASAVPVREIRVANVGVGPLEPAVVRAYLSVREGEEFDWATITRDVKTLEQSGRFSYVAVKREESPAGLTLIYEVKPKLKVRRISIEGHDALRRSRILGAVGFEAGDFVDDATAAVAARNIGALYRERYYFDAKIDYFLETDEQSGDTIVYFRIDEGQRGHVRRVEFIGNESVSSRELRKAMRQKRRGFFSFITRSGVFDPDLVATDIETIRYVYMDKGYLDVKVAPPEYVQITDRKIDIRITIQEGRLYRIGSLAVAGAKIFPTEQLEGALTVKGSEVASLGAIQRAAGTVRDFYGRRGYIRTRVSPDFDVHQESGVVNLTFQVAEGTQATIRDILIRGNNKTKDKVIRRELTVYPGEVFNEVRVRTSERRLQNLGYFDRVTSTEIPTDDPGLYDLQFEVNEQKTGQFIVGMGFSSIDDLIGFAEITQGNFDIKGWPYFTGGGQKLRLRGQAGTKRRDVELSFVEPWFLDRKLSFEVDLFQRDRRFLSDDYDQRNTGGQVGLGRALGRFSRVKVFYGLEEIDVYDVDETASDIIKDEEGKRIKSSLTLQLIRDTRDNFFVSTRGNRSSLTLEGAGGPLGGETDLYRLEARTSQYWSPWWDHVVNLRLWASVVEEHGDSDRVPIFDRLFLGGARTLRGFKFRDVGPKDDQGEPIGGKSGAYATLEYTVPLGQVVRLATYYDIGMIWPDAYEFETSLYNSDVGLGVRFDIPGFPLRFDYAWPLEADEFNDRSGGRFNFLIGHVF